VTIGGTFNPCIRSQEDIRGLSKILNIDPHKFNRDILDELENRSQEYLIRKEYSYGPNATNPMGAIRDELKLTATASEKMISRLEVLGVQSKEKLIDTAILKREELFTKYVTYRKGLPDTYDCIDKFLDDIKTFQQIILSTMDRLSPAKKKRKRASLQVYIAYLYSLFTRLTGERPPHRVYNIYEDAFDAPFFLFVKACLQQIDENFKNTILGAQIETVFKSKKVKTPSK
jgi:hypothetical protein